MLPFIDIPSTGVPSLVLTDEDPNEVFMRYWEVRDYESMSGVLNRGLDDATIAVGAVTAIWERKGWFVRRFVEVYGEERVDRVVAIHQFFSLLALSQEILEGPENGWTESDVAGLVDAVTVLPWTRHRLTGDIVTSILEHRSVDRIREPRSADPRVMLETTMMFKKAYAAVPEEVREEYNGWWLAKAGGQSTTVVIALRNGRI